MGYLLVVIKVLFHFVYFKRSHAPLYQTYYQYVLEISQISVLDCFQNRIAGEKKPNYIDSCSRNFVILFSTVHVI